MGKLYVVGYGGKRPEDLLGTCQLGSAAVSARHISDESSGREARLKPTVTRRIPWPIPPTKAGG